MSALKNPQLRALVELISLYTSTVEGRQVRVALLTAVDIPDLSPREVAFIRGMLDRDGDAIGGLTALAQRLRQQGRLAAAPSSTVNMRLTAAIERALHATYGADFTDANEGAL